MLARLILDMRPELVVHLFERLQEGVRWGGWEDVVVFLAHVARNPGHRILGRWAPAMMPRMYPPAEI